MFSIQTKERLGSIENHMNQVSFLQFSIGSSEYFLSSEMEDTKLLLWSAKKYDQPKKIMESVSASGSQAVLLHAQSKHLLDDLFIVSGLYKKSSSTGTQGVSDLNSVTTIFVIKTASLNKKKKENNAKALLAQPNSEILSKSAIRTNLIGESQIKVRT